MRILRRLASSENGNMAIEMAMVAPPFLLVLLSIIDLGLTLLTQSVLDGAARDAARLVRTQQIQNGGSITTFQNQLCAGLAALMSNTQCQANVLFEVQVFPDFSSASFTACTVNANGAGPGTKCTFTPGTPTQTVGVRVSYQRPYLIPWVSGCLTGGSCWTGLGTSTGSNPGTGRTTLVSTVIFQNEP
jgi:Flp pilus assembly protein TadG